ncbi:MAG: TonB-dependent siderophore receptor [Pseudomonadota bacterium]
MQIHPMAERLLAPISGLAFFAAAFHPSLVLAQDDDKSWQVKDEIVVVGDQDDSYQADRASLVKGNIPLIDWPQSIQVLNRTLIEEQGSQSLTELLVNVSSVVPNHEQETVLVNPFIRGQEAEIYLDGLIGYGDTAVLDPSSLAVVERVEVAKGATSTLFGGGVGAPTGGLINLVTPTPFDDPRYAATLRVGSFDTRAVTLDLNQPLSNTVGFRFTGESFESDDMINAVSVDRLTLNPSARVLLSDVTSLTVRGFYNRIEQLEYSGLPAEVAGLPNVSRTQFTGATNSPPTEVENVSVHATLDHGFSEQLTAKVDLRYFENQFDEYSSFPFLSFFPIDGTTVPIIRGQLPVDTDELTMDASLSYEFSTSGGVLHRLLVGFTADATDYQAGSGFDFTPIGLLDYASGENTLDFGPIPPINSTSVNEYRTLAFYLQDHIEIGERWRILLSGRISRYGLEEIEGGNNADETYTEFDPRIGITYRLSDSVSLFAGAATGSRIVPFFSGVSGAAPVPEESESFEAGIKISSDQWTGTIAAFRIDRSNISTLDLNDPFFGSVQNGEQRSEGLEADFIWEPSEQLSLLANASYIDATNQSDIVSFGTVFAAGNRLSRVPELSGRLAARYRVSDGRLAGLGFGVGMTYADEAPLTDANVFNSDAYTVFDAQLSKRFGAVNVSLNVMNLFDREYFKPYQFLLQEVVRPGQERSVFLTVGVEL